MIRSRKGASSSRVTQKTSIILPRKKSGTTPKSKLSTGKKGPNVPVFTGHKGPMKKRRIGGRQTLEKYEDRLQFVALLVAKRISYPEIAKAFADKYKVTRKAAYNWLRRMNASAARQIETDVSNDGMLNAFGRLVLSIEDSVRNLKLQNDYKGAIAGDIALSALYGFNKGAFLKVVAEEVEKKKKEKKLRKKVSSKALSLGEDTSMSMVLGMKDLMTSRLEDMLSNQEAVDLLEESENLGNSLTAQTDTDEEGVKQEDCKEE